MAESLPLDTRHSLVDALVAHGPDLVAAVIERMRADIPVYSFVDLDQLMPDAYRTALGLLAAVAEQRGLTDAEVAVFTEHGRARGRQGIPLTEMFRGWRLAVRGLLDEITKAGRALGIDDRALLDLSTEALALTDAAALAMARGHMATEFELASHDQQRRADLVRGILFGTLGPAEIRIEAERYGLDPERDYHALRARPTPELPAETLTRLLEPPADRPRGLIAVVDGDLAGIVAAPPTGSILAAVGLGPATRLDRMEPSFRKATRAMSTAHAFGLRGIHTLAELGLLPAILADTEVGEEVAARYVTPLGDTDSAAALLDTVEHYLTNGMRVDRTAEAMRLHTNTVRYRLRRYEHLVGIDLSDPTRALEIWWALRFRLLR
ncbi:PucR family transcriptional regulator [Nocardia sp. NPDC051570]|uniref:PucR family transcriptional regulator n=1 Tax=Nocardia sp. NPDC051570 TaxID=3364324 RepID=UPI003798F1A4